MDQETKFWIALALSSWIWLGCSLFIWYNIRELFAKSTPFFEPKDPKATSATIDMIETNDDTPRSTDKR